jgi:hypothetical protein
MPVSPDGNGPVPVIVEHAGVEQLVLHVELAAPAVFRPQVLIRERGLRVLVPPPVPGMAGEGVQVPPVLLHVLAVIALLAGQPVRALLQDRIAAIPQRQPRPGAVLLADLGELLGPPVIPAADPEAPPKSGTWKMIGLVSSAQ